MLEAFGVVQLLNLSRIKREFVSTNNSPGSKYTVPPFLFQMVRGFLKNSLSDGHLISDDDHTPLLRGPHRGYRSHLNKLRITCYFASREPNPVPVPRIRPMTLNAGPII